MRSHGVIVLPPPFDQDLSLAQRVEDLPIEELIPELPIEGLTVAVLPRAPRLDEQGAHLEPGELLPDALRTELGVVVRAQVIRTAPGDEQIGKAASTLSAVRCRRTTTTNTSRRLRF